MKFEIAFIPSFTDSKLLLFSRNLCIMLKSLSTGFSHEALVGRGSIFILGCKSMYIKYENRLRVGLPGSLKASNVLFEA